jgi:hypothetical protein
MSKTILKYLIILFSVFLMLTCADESEHKIVIKRDCPCDSSLTVKKNNKLLTQCFIGRSMIEIEDISTKGTNDTFAVCRYIYIDSIKKWRMQEGMGIANEKIITLDKAFYCDFKEEKSGYLITFIRNEANATSGINLVIEDLKGSSAIIGKDTISSIDTTLFIPKNKFKGMIKINKIMNAIFKGEKVKWIASIQIEAENLIKYGNLLEQYKAIKNNCDPNFR